MDDGALGRGNPRADRRCCIHAAMMLAKKIEQRQATINRWHFKGERYGRQQIGRATTVFIRGSAYPVAI